ALLRILFSRLGEPHIGPPSAFSFNVATARGAGAVTVERGEGRGQTDTKTFEVVGGMCPRCEGTGTVTGIDPRRILDWDKSLNQGAIQVPGYRPGGWSVRYYAESGFFDPDKPIRDYTEQELHDLLYREATKVKISGVNMTYEGLIPRIRKSFLAKDRESMQPHIRRFVDRA